MSSALESQEAWVLVAANRKVRWQTICNTLDDLKEAFPVALLQDGFTPERVAVIPDGCKVCRRQKRGTMSEHGFEWEPIDE